MKYLLAALLLVGLGVFVPTVEAQSCAKCWESLEGNKYCGYTTHNAAESCTLKNSDYCTESGVCEGMDGPECSRPCVQYRYVRSEEHTSELQSQSNLVCRLLLE